MNTDRLFEILKIKRNKLNIFIPLNTKAFELLNTYLPIEAKSLYDEIEFGKSVLKGDYIVTSPYILYKINNRMLAYICKEELDKEVSSTNKLLSCIAINPNDISIYEVKDNSISNTLSRDINKLIRANSFDKEMHKIMYEFRYLLNYWKD